MKFEHRNLYSTKRLHYARTMNSELLRAFRRHQREDSFARSHYFGDRYENLYLARRNLPEIEPLLQAVLGVAAELLSVSEQALKVGFWFNAMQPGQATLPHTHDDYDELLSAVYYLQVPRHSGNLVLTRDDHRYTVLAEEGKLVIFSPETLHEVTENLSQSLRLSIAMNIGLGDG
jgi:hypothetical protein